MGHLKSLGLVMLAQLFLWLLLNIGVPLFSPMFVLFSITPVVGPSVSRALMRESIGEGQLFWVAIGISATGIYEIATIQSSAPWSAAGCVVFGSILCGVALISLVALAASVAAGHFKAQMGTALSTSDGIALPSNVQAMLAAIGGFHSPALRIKWSVRASIVSVSVTVGFHSVGVLWPSVL
jgi:hypothetical protein